MGWPDAYYETGQRIFVLVKGGSKALSVGGQSTKIIYSLIQARNILANVFDDGPRLAFVITLELSTCLVADRVSPSR